MFVAGECHTPLASSAGMTAFDVDEAIEARARRQHGVFSHRQALDEGATERMIHARVFRRRWVVLSPAVYAMPSSAKSWERTLMGAVLGEVRAAVWGRSAAALHELDGFHRGRPEIVVPRGSNHRSRLAVVRERREFQTTTVRQVPVVTLADTIFAIAGACSNDRVAAALDGAVAAHQVTVNALLDRYLELAPYRSRGLGLMRRLLAVRCEDGFQPPQSVLEGLLYDVLDQPRMPTYERQFSLPWSSRERVDAAILGAKVIIESDGRRWHTRVEDFDRDRRRDRVAALHGYRTLRYTYFDLRDHPAHVAQEIRSLARPAAQLAPAQ
jgi:very-short-patch-repair endonuclease